MNTQYFTTGCIILFFVMNCKVASAQQPLEITESRQANVITLFASNNSKNEVEFSFDLMSKGFLVSKALPIKEKLESGQKLELLQLTAPPNTECSYETNVTYNVVRAAPSIANQRMTFTSLDEKVLNIFTKDGCNRCSFTLASLTEKGIEFNELNTSIHHPNMELMFNILKKNNHVSESVMMPVIVYKDEVYYNIQDLEKLIFSFKK